MVKIIKEGKVPTFQVTCSYCNSVLEYIERDITYGCCARFITCPLCEENVDLNNVKDSDQKEVSFKINLYGRVVRYKNIK